MIEFTTPPNNIETFTDMLDQTLQEINTDYAAKRKGNMALKRPLIRVMKSNTFFNWLKDKGKLGGQNKVPRLANERTHLEQILEYNK